MGGTWKVTSYGLVGAVGGAAIVVLAAAAGVDVAAWLLARIWWILGTVAACGALACWGALWLGRYNDRHAAAVWARSDRLERPIALTAMVQPPPEPRPQLSEPSKPAIHHHHGAEFHIYGADGQDAAAQLIRKALTEGHQL
jgi:hypothetical protein